MQEQTIPQIDTAIHAWIVRSGDTYGHVAAGVLTSGRSSWERVR